MIVVLDGGGIKSPLLKLVCYPVEVMRMPMPDGDHGMAAVKVQVFPALFIVYIGALAPDGLQVV